MKNLSASLIFVVLACVATCEVRAFDYGMPWFGYGYSGSLYGLGYLPVPPYYAVHPPVQYSSPTSFAYGQSPFALQRHEQRLIVEPPAQQPIVNPFVAAAANSPSPPAPRIIVNPYYKESIPAKAAENEKIEKLEKS